MRTLYILVFLALAFPFQGTSQILNIEKSALDRDTTKLILSNITSSMVLYNRSAAIDEPVEFIGFDLKSSVAYFPGRHRLSSITNINYLKINDAPFLNTGYQHFRFDFRKNRKVHPEAFAQYQYDNFRGLSPRLLAGAGMRHRILTNEHFTLIFSMGLMYEHENWRDPYSGEKVLVKFWKSTNYVVFRVKISEWADFNGIQYYQTVYDNSIDKFRNRFSTDINLNAKLTNKLLWTTSFTLSYENEPIVPIVRTIYRLANGLTYKF
jgi:hypothetical protein